MDSEIHHTDWISDFQSIYCGILQLHIIGCWALHRGSLLNTRKVWPKKNWPGLPRARGHIITVIKWCTVASILFLFLEGTFNLFHETKNEDKLYATLVGTVEGQPQSTKPPLEKFQSTVFGYGIEIDHYDISDFQSIYCQGINFSRVGYVTRSGLFESKQVSPPGRLRWMIRTFTE